MPLTTEDGSLVEGADTYVTREQYIAYAARMGVTIADETAADVELAKAAEFIGSKEARLKGERVDRDQALAFPRDGVTIDGWSWSKTEIPRQVILCQLALALDVHAGIDLHNPPQSESTGIKRERVEGAVEVEYALGEAPSKLSRQSTATALLNSLLRSAGLTLVRT